VTDRLCAQFKCFGAFTLEPRQVGEVGEGKADAVLIASCPRHARAFIERLLDPLRTSTDSNTHRPRC
jgi:hypothetical protein